MVFTIFVYGYIYGSVRKLIFVSEPPKSGTNMNLLNDIVISSFILYKIKLNYFQFRLSQCQEIVTQHKLLDRTTYEQNACMYISWMCNEIYAFLFHELIIYNLLERLHFWFEMLPIYISDMAFIIIVSICNHEHMHKYIDMVQKGKLISVSAADTQIRVWIRLDISVCTPILDPTIHSLLVCTQDQFIMFLYWNSSCCS